MLSNTGAGLCFTSRSDMRQGRLLIAASALFLSADGSAVQAQSDPELINALKPAYQRAPARAVENPALVDLGRLLFWDPRASASGKTACASCHLPNLGWATIEAKSRNDSGKLTSRKSQTLLGIGHIEGVP